MSRPKRYASEAEKQRAYRERKKKFGERTENNPSSSAKEPAVPVLACANEKPVITVAGCEARESTEMLERSAGDERPAHSRGGRLPPSGIPEREWKYACERAERARKYAAHFLLPPSSFCFPLWQWENEVKGRFGGIIGGSLSGSRGPDVLSIEKSESGMGVKDK